MAVLMITHDLGSSRNRRAVVVAYAGQSGGIRGCGHHLQIARPPYTQALYNSIPRLTDTKNDAWRWVSKHGAKPVGSSRRLPLSSAPAIRPGFLPHRRAELISISENHRVRASCMIRIERSGLKYRAVYYGKPPISSNFRVRFSLKRASSSSAGRSSSPLRPLL